jgi:hypothetical protein
MIKVAFKRRSALNLPLISRIYKLILSFLIDNLYPTKNIESALKKVFSKRSIFDHFFTFFIEAKIRLSVATIRKPEYRIFINYNGVEERREDDKANSSILIRF